MRPLRWLLNELRTSFLAGLLVIVPVAGTLLIVRTVVTTVDGWWPKAYRPHLGDATIPGVGIALFIVAALIVGAFARNYVGDRVVRLGEWLFERIPFVSTVYGLFKKTTAALFKKDSTSFSRAHLVEWPRKGAFTIGFETADVDPAVAAAAGRRDLVAVYVPTTPNPTGGYFMMFERSELIELPMTVEQAWTFVLSMGIIGVEPGRGSSGAIQPLRPRMTPPPRTNEDEVIPAG